MLRVLCHVSFVLFLSLLCVDVRVMCSHAWYHVYGYALLGSMCLYAFCYVLCLASVHVYMLGFTFFDVYVLAFTCSHTSPYPLLDLHFYMFACLDLGFHMLICPDLYFCMLMCLDRCSTCIMSSFVCLCALCLVWVPIPRLYLSCHVLL